MTASSSLVCYKEDLDAAADFLSEEDKEEDLLELLLAEGRTGFLSS